MINDTAVVKKLNVIIVIEDHPHDQQLLTQHGLAFWVQADNTHLLYDTGPSPRTLTNIERLDLPLNKLHAIVLSHGHYDHTGGLPAIADKLPTDTPIFMHPLARRTRYNCAKSPAHSNGMTDETLALISRHPDRLRWTSEPTPVAPAIWCTGQVPRHIDFENSGGNFFLDPYAEEPDTLPDDQALIIHTPSGWVLLSGCGHAGIVNIITYTRQLLPHAKIHALIGGLHMKNASPSRIDKTIDFLRSRNIDLIAPCHCTGKPTVTALQNTFADHVTLAACGSRFSFPA